MDSSNRTRRRVIIVMLLVIFSLLQLQFFNWIPDDAYISFRYARNLASGKGLVFNTGEKVEGLSNLSWTLMLAGAAKLGFDIVRTAVVLSTITAFLSLILLFHLMNFASSYSSKYPGAILESAFMLGGSVFFPLVFYASSGMETSTYLALILSGAVLNLRGMLTRKSRLLPLSSFLFFLASTTRPEGVLFLLLNLFFILKKRRDHPRKVVYASLIPVALYVGFQAARITYFGHVLPNTFYAKPGSSFHYLQPIGRGLSYLVHFFIKSGFVALIPFALIPSFKREGRYIRAYLWSLIFAQLFFIVYVGADVLRFDRFSLPFYPFLLTLSLMGFAEIAAGNEKSLRKAAKGTAIMCVLFIFSLNVGRAFFVKNNPCKHDWMHGGTLRTIGTILDRALPAKSTIVANEIGAVSYYSGRTLIDMLGLTDKTISRIRFASFQKFGAGSSAESVEKVADYIMGKKPQCIIIPSYTDFKDIDLSAPGEAMHPLWFAIFSNRLFSGDYMRVASFKIHNSKFINIFIRNGTVFTDAYLRDELPRPCLQRIE